MNRAAAASSPIIVTTREELASLIREALAAERADQAQDVGPKLLDRAGISRVLGIGLSLVDRFRKQGMPCVFVGDQPRFLPDECLDWIRTHRRVPPKGDE